MPILNIELIKKAIKKINTVKEKIVIKKGQVYTVGVYKVSVKSFEGNNVHLVLSHSSHIMDGNEIATSKENLIKAIQTKDIAPVRHGNKSVFQKRINEIGQPLAEAISSSPTVIKAKFSKRGDSNWMVSPPISNIEF